MTQYIDKSAVVAEIERRLNELSQLEKASYEIGLFDAYKIILSFLDTLEAKDAQEESISKELEELINELSKQFPVLLHIIFRDGPVIAIRNKKDK